MNKKILSIFYFILLTFISFSQIVKNESCGVKNNSIFNNKKQINFENVYSFLDSCNYSPFKNNIKYRVPIKFWIYRKSNGKGGLKLSEIKNYIRNLNYYYSLNNTGISFYLRPDIEYIDKDRLYKLNYYNQAPFQTMKHKDDYCINVFITKKLEKKRFFKNIKNYSGNYNYITKGVIITKGVSSSTLSHEIGHFFGLKHPHRNWKSKTKGEPVSRTKLIFGTNTKMCEKKGDGLCDTPAEPNLANYTDNKCNYTGWNVTDRYGIVYKPNTNNIMSYTRNRECRSNFTEQQKALMLYTASQMKFSKKWATNNMYAKNYDFDYFEPDDYKEMASEIFYKTKQTHTFHKILSSKDKTKYKDTVDWLYFNLNINKPKDISITISKTDYDFPNLSISVFKGGIQFYKTELNKNNIKIIKLKQLKKGKYYIEIKKTSTEENITGYKIYFDNSK